jgi:serine/threonine protein kinase
MEGGRAADVYACGVHLFKMLFKQYPFGGRNAVELAMNIMQRDIMWPNIEIDNEITDLLTRMLERRWELRITIPEIMRHPAYLENLPAEIEV